MPLRAVGVVAGLISVPVVSRPLGCTPLGPVDWGLALATATVATGAVAAPTHVLPDRDKPEPEPPRADVFQPGAASPVLAPRAPRRATAAHKAPVMARSATQQSGKSGDRPGCRSSSYSRR